MFDHANQVNVTKTSFQYLNHLSYIRKIDIVVINIWLDIGKYVITQARDKVWKLILLGVLPLLDKIVRVYHKFKMELCNKKVKFVLIALEFVWIRMRFEQWTRQGRNGSVAQLNNAELFFVDFLSSEALLQWIVLVFDNVTRSFELLITIIEQHVKIFESVKLGTYGDKVLFEGFKLGPVSA